MRRNEVEQMKDALGQDFDTDVITRSVTSTTAVLAAALTPGRYRLAAYGCNMFFKRCLSDGTVTVATGHPLFENSYEWIDISADATRLYIAVICESGASGTLYISKQRVQV